MISHKTNYIFNAKINTVQCGAKIQQIEKNQFKKNDAMGLIMNIFEFKISN